MRSCGAYDVNAKIYFIGKMKPTDDIASVKGAITYGSTINRDLFKDIGLFDKRLFLYYVDNYFCLRARKAVTQYL